MEPSQIRSFIDPRRDRDAINICAAAGIRLMSGELIKLRELRQAVQNSIDEMKRASGWEEFVSRGLLTANMVKATCDAFIEMAGGLGNALGIKGAKDIAKGYGAISTYTMAGAQAAAGQKVDWTKVATTAGKSLAGRAAGYKDVAELQVIKADIVISSVKGNSPKALQITFVKLLPKIAEMSLDYMEKKTASRWTAAASAVVNAGMNYSQALEAAFDDRIEDEAFSRESRQRANDLARHLQSIDGRIEEIDIIMRECAISSVHMT